LIGIFIRQNNPRMGLNIAGVTPRAMRTLINHSWPGNIRELRNVIERAMLFCDDEFIDLGHLPAEVITTDQGG
jgi:transcriptional regulator with PAS, ATPase and Fis domain